jgi:predicted dehydrogenase
MPLDIGFVGTGATPDDPDSDGFAMAYRHAQGYQRLDDCRLRACADIVPENAAAFADEFGIDAVFKNSTEMVDEVDLDIVSVCVPPGVHADVVIECAQTGDVAAIHCEKPMAKTWQNCKEMVEVCESEGVQLTINHQRRLGPTYRTAKELLNAGKIGDLQRIELATENLYDAGTHLFDLTDFFTDGTSAEWMLAQVDYREENIWFGAHNENQALAQWRYENGVYGLASMGAGQDAVDCYLRLRGTEGTIEIGATDGPPLWIRHGKTLGWRTIDTGENIWGDRNLTTIKAGIAKLAPMVPVVPDNPFPHRTHIERAIESVVRAVKEGKESELNARTALRGTELVFAAWESVRQRGRIDLPLEIEDNPLESMVESGKLPVGRERQVEHGANSSADSASQSVD